MTAAKHRIHVREATLADVPTMVDIHFASFGEDVINQLMYPGGPSEDVKAKFGTSLLPPSDTSQSSEIFVLVAELFPEDDPAGAGEIIAFAKWSLRRNPIPESEWNVKKTITAETLGEGINVDIYIWFIEFLHARLSELVRGDAMLYLKILACSPKRQRLGAGSALLRWGTELADSLGLVSWLESSAYGYPVYKRAGYEDVLPLDFKITETWGATKAEGRDWGESAALELGGPVPEGTMRSVIMKRLPKPTV